jgi:putative membrane protein
VLLVAGLVLFAFLLHEFGSRAILDDLRRVGFGIVPIVLQEVLAYACNTLGWRCAFPGAVPPKVGFWRLMGARIAGDAINAVTPTATLGGEVVRVRLLRDRASATAVVAASVAIAKLTQTVGQVVYVLCGVALLLWVFETPLGESLRHGLAIGIPAIVVLLAVGVWLQRRGLFAPMVRAARRLGLLADSDHLHRRLERLDQEIAAFHLAGSRRFVESSAWFAMGWALGLLEAGLILYFLGIPVTFERVLAIEVLAIAIDGVLFFVPGKVGTQEGGKVLIFALLGLVPAEGLAFGILRRIRELVWSGFGLLLLSRMQARVGAAPNGARGPALDA